MRHRIVVTIETDENAETARDWIEEAVGDAFACAPEDLQVEFLALETGGAAQEGRDAK